MRSFGTVDSPKVQADRHGPSITTRSPEARTRANRSRNGPTSPPGLARMRTSAAAGAAKTTIESNANIDAAFRIRGLHERCRCYVGKQEACGKVLLQPR